jgi:hypothetical protein
LYIQQNEYTMQSIIKEIKLTNIIINNYIYPFDYLPFDNDDKLDKYDLKRSKFLYSHLLNYMRRSFCLINIKLCCKNTTHEMINNFQWLWVE